MSKIPKATERRAREAISNTVEKICGSALYISVITKQTHWKSACECLSAEQFVALTNIPKDLWMKLVSAQSEKWCDLIQIQFEFTMEKQQSDVADILKIKFM